MTTCSGCTPANCTCTPRRAYPVGVVGATGLAGFPKITQDTDPLPIGMVEVPTSPAPKGVDAVLAERGSRYGLFKDHAEVTQSLKAIFKAKMGAKWDFLADDQRESLEMIAHKLGRIINGDPNYSDSWTDIAGYAQLVADRLDGKVR